MPVTVEARDLRIALSGAAGVNALLSLRTGDETYLTLAREMQRHPVRGTVTHVDFQIVRRDQVISAEVPITLVGEAVEVAHGDGLVDQQLFTLTVQALPGAIPPALEIDISDLTIGGAVRVSELTLPEGVATETDPEAVVVAGQAPRVEALAAEGEEGEGEAPAEGAEAAPSEDEGAGGEG